MRSFPLKVAELAHSLTSPCHLLAKNCSPSVGMRTLFANKRPIKIFSPTNDQPARGREAPCRPDNWPKKVSLGCVRTNFQNAASSMLFGPSYLVVSNYVGFKVPIQMICLSAV